MVKSLVMMAKIIILILSVGPYLLWAQDTISAEVENKAYWLCKNRKEVRTIRIQMTRPGICSTFYSKLGEEKRVGSGKNQESCVTFMNNIRTNLEKSNWACRDIIAARITASSDAE